MDHHRVTTQPHQFPFSFAKRRRVVRCGNHVSREDVANEEGDTDDNDSQDEREDDTTWATDINYVTSTDWKREEHLEKGPLALLDDLDVGRLQDMKIYWEILRFFRPGKSLESLRSAPFTHVLVYLNDLCEDDGHAHEVFRIDESPFCLVAVVGTQSKTVECYYYLKAIRDALC